MYEAPFIEDTGFSNVTSGHKVGSVMATEDM